MSSSRKVSLGALCVSTLLLGAASAPPAPSATPPATATESDHLVVSHAPGLDEILVPYLVEALEAERERLAGSGAAVADGRLEVEIVAGPADLDRATSLGAKDVAGGIAAVCEQGKLVLTSPRAAVGGYPWIDAAVREYRRCAAATAPSDRPASVPVRWRGAPPPKRAPGAKAELARDHARLGDILRARGRHVPARIEYEKAVRRGGSKDPDVVAGYAESALATDAPDAAEAPLRSAAREHPRHARVQAALGELEARKGNHAAARDAYASAIRVDPFDAAVHAGLGEALEALGDATGASRESRIAGMLRK